MLALLGTIGAAQADDLRAVDAWVNSNEVLPEERLELPIEWRIHRVADVERFEQLIQRRVYRYQREPCLRCEVLHVSVDGAGTVTRLESVDDFSALLRQEIVPVVDATTAGSIASAFLRLSLYTRVQIVRLVDAPAAIPSDGTPQPRVVIEEVAAPRLRATGIDSWEYTAYSWSSWNGDVTRHTVTLDSNGLSWSTKKLAEGVGTFGSY